MAHPYFQGYPINFFDEQNQYDKPPINVYKIYAPKIYFMSGNDESSFRKDKQMIPSNGNSFLNRIMDTPISPEEYFGQEDDVSFDFDEDFESEPSNSVSRKMSAYAPFAEPPSLNMFTSPSMHMDNMPSPHQWDDERVGIPDYRYNDLDQLDYDYPDYHRDQIVSDYPTVPTSLSLPTSIPTRMPLFDQLLQNAPRMSKPYFSSIPQVQTPIAIEEMPSSLTALFAKILSKSANTQRPSSEYITTITFGEPELMKSETAAIANQILELDTPQKSNKLAKSDESLESNSQEISDQTPTSVEIERNFVKTIYPDNSTATEEVGSPQLVLDSSSSSEKSSEDVDQVEVNVVKTILPDNSYMIGQAGGKDEHYQNEVISMIQNQDETHNSRQSRFLPIDF